MTQTQPTRLQSIRATIAKWIWPPGQPSSADIRLVRRFGAKVNQLRQSAHATNIDLASRVSDLEIEIANLQLDAQRVQSELDIRSLEVAKLTEVIERDRARVEAETAIAARQVADSRKG